ncbi:hypothetical protein LCGC14_1424970 [marine sediment metagenome]|uniref:Uncharacterized protein n=1 Tax=marine sediment metagenome TaxID=412755 RepID=A0A0F9MS01_9ZZZZ
MEVHVVIWREWDSMELVGVYSTKEGANTAINNHDDPVSCNIYEFTMELA